MSALKMGKGNSLSANSSADGDNTFGGSYTNYKSGVSSMTLFMGLGAAILFTLCLTRRI